MSVERVHNSIQKERAARSVVTRTSKVGSLLDAPSTPDDQKLHLGKLLQKIADQYNSRHPF